MEEQLSKNKLFERNQKRRELLATYLYDVSKLIISGVGIGGLSPLVTGDTMSIYNYLCAIFGSAASIVFAYTANRLFKTRK